MAGHSRRHTTPLAHMHYCQRVVSWARGRITENIRDINTDFCMVFSYDMSKILETLIEIFGLVFLIYLGPLDI